MAVQGQGGVSKLRKSALAVAEQKKASVAGSAILSNQYVSVDASWLTSAFIVVTKANDTKARSNPTEAMVAAAHTMPNVPSNGGDSSGRG